MKIDARLMFLFATFSLVAAFLKDSWSLSLVALLSFAISCFHHLADDIVHRNTSKSPKDEDILRILQMVNDLELKHRTIASKVENLEIKSTLGL